MKKLILISLVLTSGIIFSGCTNKEPEIIERNFKNGTSISVEVDEDLTSENWDCTGDCSGHIAGYEWAERKGITDPSDCGGYSVSFIEGCEAYANENY